MTISRKLSAVAVLSSLLSTAACHGDYLSGGQLTTDPNRPTVTTARNLFVTVQSELWNLWGGDPARVTGIYAQQNSGIGGRQYTALDETYSQDPNTTNGFHAALYGPGGLVDIKQIETISRTNSDTLMLGIADVIEGATMGTGADLFGSLVYSQALKGTQNPTLDTQAQVYDSVQKVLSAGIANLTATGGAARTASGVNAGPGAADLVYGGSGSRWRALAHTLKARFYMHNGEIDPTNYARALAEAQQGISSNAGNYHGSFTSKATEQNFYYQFNDVQRGDLGVGATLDSILLARNDPRRATYFTLDAGQAVDFGDNVNDPTYPTVYVSFDENTLIWAEAAYRTGDMATALAKLNQERANNGLPAEPAGLTGRPLLNEILIEKYIADFQLGEEAWNDYKRTCTPNLAPHATGKKIPGRYFYDSGEQQTNTNIPAPGTGINGLKNANDPANATSDGTGAVCKGQ